MVKEKITELICKRKVTDFLILILISYVIFLPMFNNDIDVYADDGIQHIARAYGTFESIKNGIFLGNIIYFFSNNFGYSWNLFYGPFSTFGIIFFRLFCNSYITSYKLFTYFCLVFSAFSMYKFIFEMTKNNNTALISSALYITFPYHLTDLYIRNALGEFISFIFIPLVFLGLYEIINTKKKSYFLCIGVSGLILSHNISTLFVSIFAFIYLCVCMKSIMQKDKIKILINNVIFILLITSFFWIPMLEAKNISNYQVYEHNSMSTIKSVESNTLTINQIFVTKKNGSFVFELGPHIFIMIALSIMVLRILKENRKEYILFLILGLISLWMCTKYFPWKFMPRVLLIIQFPWRLMIFVCFFFSIVCSINMSVLIKKFNMKDAIIIIIICVLYTVSLNDFVPYDEFNKEIEEYSLGLVSGVENEVIIGEGRGEYLPTNAFNNKVYLAIRKDEAYFLQGEAIVEEEIKEPNKYLAKIKTLDEQTILELPYIYYPGYKVIADGMNIESFETENGFLGVKLLPNDSFEIEATYEGTTLMKVSLMISIFSMICFAILNLKDYKSKVK